MSASPPSEPAIPEGTEETVTLWRPLGPAELQLIAGANYLAFPPRLPGQPIFYPVLSEAYAICG